MIAKSLTTNEAQEQTASADAVTWLRLGSLAAAFALSAYGYTHHRYIDEWWYWVGDLVLASALLCFAFADDTKAPESTLRRVLRGACGIVSIASWAAAIHYGGQQGSELEAGIATFAALITFFVARWVPVSDRDALCLNSGSDTDAWAWTGSSWVLGAAGLATAIAAAAVNLSNSVAGFLLWLASLVLFAVAAQRCGKGTDAPVNCAWREEAGPQLAPGIALVAFAAVLFIAVALRMPLLDQYPAYINSDEGRLGHSALKQFEDGFPNMFGMGWNAFPNISTVADVLPIKILGMDIAHLRLSSAIFGVASILVTYFWARRWWGNIVALLAMLIVSFNQEHINWSRIGMNNIQQVLVGMLMLAAMARALQTRRPLDWVWFGYATGLTFLTYHAAKLFPALLFGVMVLFAISMRGFARRNFAGALIALAAFFVILAPHFAMLYLDWSNFYAGTSNRVDLGAMIEAYRAGDVYAVRSYVSSHVLATLNLFTINQYPFFDSFLAVVGLPGVGWILWRWRDPRHMAVLGWIGGILLIGGMITQYPPNVPRLIGVLPVACAIPAIIAGRARGLFGQLMPARADFVVVPLLALWLSASAYRNWEMEFRLRSGDQLGDQMTNVCHAIARTPLPCTTYTMGSLGDIDTGISPLDCMMRTDVDRQAVRRSDDPALFPIRPSNKGTALFVFGREQSGLVSVLQHYYPLATYDVVLSRDKVPHLWTATLSTDLIDRNRGLGVMWRDGKALREAERGQDVIRCDDCTAFPVEATASGLIYAAEPGKYAFRAPRAAVELNGSGIGPDEERELPAGWHHLKVATTLGSSSERCQLQWRQPGSPDWQKVPREYLHRHPARHGLLGRYFTESLPIGNPKPSAGPSAYEQLVPALIFDISPEHDEPPPPGFASKGATMEWSGTVQFPEGDTQSLRLETTSPARVFVNGVEVLASDESTAVVKEVTLTGLGPRAEILVRTVREAEPPVWFWWMRLLWRQSGGNWVGFADYEPPA